MRRLLRLLMDRFVGRPEPDETIQAEIDRRLRNLDLRVRVMQGGRHK